MKKSIFIIIALLLISFISAGDLLINSYNPNNLNLEITEGTSQEFSQNSLEGSSYTWELYKNSIISEQNKIVFSKDLKEIYSINPDGSDLKQLTFLPDASWDKFSIIYDQNPVVTKDNKIIFKRSGFSYPTANDDRFQLWSMNLDGTNQNQITNWINPDYPSITGKAVTTISLTDSKIYYGEKTGFIYRMNLDGSNEERIYPDNIISPYGNSTGVNRCSQPIISPNGANIVCKKDVLTIMNSDGTNEKSISISGSDFNWNYDGTRISYVLDNVQIGSVDLDGNNPLVLVDPICIAVWNRQEPILCDIEHRRLSKSSWLSNNELVFSADGEIYKKDLLSGDLTKLTSQNYSGPPILWEMNVNTGTVIQQNLNLVKSSSDPNFVFSPTSVDSGDYLLKLKVSNNENEQELEWNLKVNDCIDNDKDGSCANLDCNDNDGERFPGNTEICGNNIDDNCDDIDDACPTSSGGSSGGGGSSSSRSSIVNNAPNKTVEDQVFEEQDNKEETDNTQEVPKITGNVVSDVENKKGILSSIGSFFSNIFDWIANLF